MGCVYPGDDGYIHYTDDHGSDHYYVGDHKATPKERARIEAEKASRKGKPNPNPPWETVETDLTWETKEL
jgi:hypothetical protein